MQTEIQNLYYECECECAEKETKEKSLISAETLDKAITHVFEGLDVKNKIEKELFKSTWEILNKASEKGFGNIEYGAKDYEFLQEIKTNNAVFAAFKTHRQQNELAGQLLDKDDRLKSFAQFKADTATILHNYNKTWLHTEYNTAIIRARTAQQFKQFAREKYMFPNLEWLPSMAAHPREAHKIFYNRVWAQDDPFWNSNMPGTIWGCKCGIKSTDGPTMIEAIPESEIPTPAKGLDNNPSKDGKLFSNTHPYVEKAYPGAKKAVAKFIDEITPYETVKTYDNGGQIRIFKEIDRKASDYKPIYNICNQFAKEGKICEITPRIHYKDERYKEVYGSLIGTKYERKCPDFRVDGVFYEFKSYEKPFKKRKLSNMISSAVEQSSRMVIDNNKGASDNILKKALQNRIRIGQKIDELWVYEKGNIRPIK